MLRILDERVLVRDLEHTRGIGEIIIFYIIFIYLNAHKNFYSRIQQSLKFILIYNYEFKFQFFFIFIYELDRFDRCSDLTFIFQCNFFFFRSSTILVESPSTTEFNNFFFIILHDAFKASICVLLWCVPQRQQKLHMLRCGISELEELPQW